MFENKDIMQTSGNPPAGRGGRGTIGFMGAVGCHSLRSLCLCRQLWSRSRWSFKGKGYYLRLLPAQCTLWDNVLIGRDPQTAEVMLSLLREAGRRGTGGGWLAWPQQI